jgi:hypothetical protein
MMMLVDQIAAPVAAGELASCAALYQPGQGR